MRPTTIATAALVLAAGCGDSYSLVWHGENISVYAYDFRETDACAGSFDALDQHVGAVKQFLWIEDSRHYDFYWQPCTSPMHEAVHMVTGSIDHDGCPSVLDDGLAQYLDGPSPRDWAPAKADIVELLTAEHIATDMATLARAGHFVAFLVERHGTGSVVQLCNALARDSTIVDWELAVGRHLGETLDQLIAEYESYPVCTAQQFRARLGGCSGDPHFTLAVENGLFSLESACLDRRAINAAWGDLENAVITRRIEFPKDTLVELIVFSEGDSGVPPTFVSQMCVPCSGDPQTVIVDETIATVHYRAGMHEVAVFFDTRDTVQLYMAAVP